MVEGFDTITIRYDGKDADFHSIDLELLGESLQGGARLLAVAAHLSLKGVFVSKSPAMAVRVLAATSPQANCFEIPVQIVGATPLLPLLSPMGRAVGKRVIEAIVNYFLARLGGKPREADKAMEVVMAAVEANRDVSLKAIDLASQVVKAAEAMGPAARQFVAPIGDSVATAVIGPSESAFVIGTEAKERICAVEPEAIEPSRPYEVKVTELDLKTGAAKLVLSNDESNARYGATIKDPVVHNPRNPYSDALHNQTWLKVTAKAHIKHGEINHITVLDTAA